MIRKLFTWYQCQEEDPGGGLNKKINSSELIELRNGNIINAHHQEFDDDDEDDEEDEEKLGIIHYSRRAQDFVSRGNYEHAGHSSKSDISSISQIALETKPTLHTTEVEIHPIPSEINSTDNIENCDNPPSMCHAVPPMINNFIRDESSIRRCGSVSSSSSCSPLSSSLLSPPTSRYVEGSYILRGTNSQASDYGSIIGPEKDTLVGERMRMIVSSFQNRALEIKKKLERPPTPDESSSSSSSSLSSFSNRLDPRKLVYEDFDSSRYASKSTIHFDGGSDGLLTFFRAKMGDYVDPRGYVNISWLSLQALIFLYNAWVIPLRAIFPVHNGSAVWWWIFFDYFGDFIYFLDLVFYKRRVLYMENGFWIKNKRRITAHYIRNGSFKYDVLALLPTDIFYFWLGTNFVILRLPRLFKAYAYWEFINRLDSVLAKPYFLRIFKTLNYMLYLIHLNACAYYLFSDIQGIGSPGNEFIYNGEGNAYIRCFYFATKTATSIGKNKKPKTISEILFMTTSWLIGVFIFAILIGDIRDIVGTARRNVVSYQRKLDDISAYMNDNKVAKSIQHKVKTWLNYTWDTHKTFNENQILEFLPLKLRTDIAMRVHYKTLSKVKLFRNCDLGLLKDLVVLLRPVTYLQGEHVCRKGDKGTEMFIIQSGQVRVMDRKRVLVTLKRGSVFGEIALLGVVGGMNRRTADVISTGFSTLFVLKKKDLEIVLQDYPDAKRILNARAKRLIRENESRHGSQNVRQNSLFDCKRDRDLLSAVMRLRGMKFSNYSGPPMSRTASLRDLTPSNAPDGIFRSQSLDEKLMKVSRQRFFSYFSEGSTPYSLLSSENSDEE